MTLGALVNFANALELALGPIISEILGIAGLAALGWWQARKVIRREVGKVEAKAEAGIAAAHESANAANARASTAKAEVRAVKLSLASIEGSLRPAALPPLQTPLPASSGISGHYPPVSISELEKLPSPAPLPRETTAERPSAKGKQP